MWYIIVVTNCLDCGAELRGHGNPQRCRSCTSKKRHRDGLCHGTPCTALRKQRIAAGVSKAHAAGRYEGVIEKAKAAADAYWSTSEAKQAAALRAREQLSTHLFKPSKLELRVQQALTELGIKFISQYRPVGYHRVYDLLLPDYTTLIEVDGWYWHVSDYAIQSNQPQIDAEKDAWALAHGFVIARIPEDSLQGADATILLHNELLPQLK